MSASMSHLPLQPDETAANLGTIVTTTLDVSHTDDPRGTWFNQYFVNGGNSRIARGRHCTDVHRAEDQNERKVVIKVLQRKLNEDKWRHLRKSQQVSNGGLLPSEYRAQREVGILKATTRFRHPNIVPLFEVIDDPRRSKLYLVMEDVLGGAVPFEEQADDSKPVFSVAQTRRVFRDVVLGLEFLHHYGIVHRDIKPANLLIGEDGIVKICDFSVSHVLTSQRVQRTSAMDVLNDPVLFSEAPESLGSHEGTPSFIAPECVWQADFKVNPDLVSPSSTPPRPSQSSRIALSVTEDSDSESSESRDYPSCSLPFIDTLPAMQPIVTKALDIWSLGVTIYCCLFGHLPFTFTGAGSNFTMYKIICTRDWVPDVTMGRDRVPTGGRHPTDRQFEGGFAIQLLDGMLQKDPTKRLTLQEIKHHPWMLEDLPDAKLWLTITSLYTPALGEKPPRKRLSTQPHAASSGDLASPKQPEKKNWVERVGKGVTKGVGKGFRALIPGRDRSNSESRTSRKP